MPSRRCRRQARPAQALRHDPQLLFNRPSPAASGLHDLQPPSRPTVRMTIHTHSSLHSAHNDKAALTVRIRRIDIKPHYVAQFLDEVGIVGELEATEPVRLQPVRMPNALNRTGADTDLLGHHGSGPMRRFGGRITLGQRHDPLGDICPQGRNARGPCLVVQQTRRSPPP